jgi:hypothetical protein
MACRATWKRQTSEGRALLESEELIFRGDFRLVVPFREVSEATARDGKLVLVFKGGRASFALGARAESWAHKIRAPKSLIDKLGVKPGARVALLGVRDAGFSADLAARSCTTVARLDGAAEHVFLAAESRADLRRLAAIQRAMKRDAAVWVVRPKGSAAITEADMMRAGREAGLVDVKVVAFSPTHSASKFVIRVKDR